MRITSKRGKTLIVWQPHQITLKSPVIKLGDAKC